MRNAVQAPSLEGTAGRTKARLARALLALGFWACGREDIELGRGAQHAAPAAPQPEGSDPVKAPERPDGGSTVPDGEGGAPALEPSSGAPSLEPEASPEPDASSPEPVAVPGAGDAGAPGPAKPEPQGPADDCSAAVPDGLVAARPPMGWNGYNAFGEAPELDEEKLRAIVDAMVASGMQSAGYRYVNLDIGWEGPRAEDGQRTSDPVRVPGGIEALVDWVHARGFLFGAYAHIQDCGQRPGTQGFEATDVTSWVAWEIDYVKYVSCNFAPLQAAEISPLTQALEGAERSIVLSLAAPPFQEWMRETAQLFRVAENAEPTWASIVASIDAAVPLAAYARPGAFNDPDMLEIGNGTLTEGQQRVQFSVWSILAAPLLAGNDPSTMSEATRSLLTNRELIAIDQDPLGLQGALVKRQGNVEVLVKPLAACGARAVVLWNRNTTDEEVSVSFPELWLEPQAATVHDLWNASTLEAGADGFNVEVPGHDAVALRVMGGEPPLPRGTVYLSDLSPSYVTNGYGPIELDRTNGERGATDGEPIRLRGAAYEKGLGVHGPSLLRYRLGRACSRFVADVGIDDGQEGAGSVEFEVWSDGERLFRSGVVTGTSPAVSVDVDLRGRRDLRLFVSTGGDTYAFDHGVWAGAVLDCDP